MLLCEQDLLSVLRLSEFRMIFPFVEHLPQQVLHLPTVAPIPQLALPLLLIGEKLFQLLIQRRCQLRLLFLTHMTEDLCQLCRRVVLQDEFLHPAGKARIGFQKVLHVIRVTGADDDKLALIILHGLHQLPNGLLAITAAVALHLGQGIGFVNEQHAAHGAVDLPPSLLGGLPHVFPHQVGAGDLIGMSFGQDAALPIDLADELGDHGLAGAGVALQHPMEPFRHPNHAQFLRLGRTLGLEQLAQLRLDGFIAHQVIQLFRCRPSVRLGQGLLGEAHQLGWDVRTSELLFQFSGEILAVLADEPVGLGVQGVGQELGANVACVAEGFFLAVDLHITSQGAQGVLLVVCIRLDALFFQHGQQDGL